MNLLIGALILMAVSNVLRSARLPDPISPITIFLNVAVKSLLRLNQKLEGVDKAASIGIRNLQVLIAVFQHIAHDFDEYPNKFGTALVGKVVRVQQPDLGAHDFNQPCAAFKLMKRQRLKLLENSEMA
jgi:hypothetical protein